MFTYNLDVMIGAYIHLASLKYHLISINVDAIFWVKRSLEKEPFFLNRISIMQYSYLGSLHLNDTMFCLDYWMKGTLYFNHQILVFYSMIAHHVFFIIHLYMYMFSNFVLFLSLLRIQNVRNLNTGTRKTHKYMSSKST